LSIGENGFPQPWRQIAGGQQVYGNAKQVLKLHLKGAKIEQGRPGKRVDKNVEIASLFIGAVQRRPEDARVRRAKPPGCFTNRNSMLCERDRRLQGGILHDD
jgi:hypothetical protein